MADEAMKEISPDMLRAVSMFLTLSRIEPESAIAALAYLRAANDGWTVPEMRTRLHRLIDGLQVDEAALAELAASFDEAHTCGRTWREAARARPCNEQRACTVRPVVDRISGLMPTLETERRMGDVDHRRPNSLPDVQKPASATRCDSQVVSSGH